MAKITDAEIIDFGDQTNRKRMVLRVPALASVADKPGILILEASGGSGAITDYCLWVDRNGVLRSHTSIPTNEDADGSAVGAAASVDLDDAYDNGAAINGAISSGTAIKLGGAGASDNISLYHDATDFFMINNTGIFNIQSAADITLTPSGHDVNLVSSNLNIISNGTYKLTLGTAGAADSYISYSATAGLTFYDDIFGVAVTLSSLAQTALTNPTITGDATITEGKLTWTDAVDETAGAFTFAGVANDSLTITAAGQTSGNVITVTGAAITTNGAIISAVSALTAGAYFEAHTGAASIFTVGRYGAVTVAGSGAADAFTATLGHVQITNGDIDMDEGKIEVDSTADETSYVNRNLTAATTPVFQVQQTHTGATGPALQVHQHATGNAIALDILTEGDYAAINLAAGATRTGPLINCVMANQLTERALYVTGAWTGTSTYGAIDVNSSGIMAADAALVKLQSNAANTAASFLLDVRSTGNCAGSTLGICEHIVETGTAAGTSYVSYITSTANRPLGVYATATATPASRIFGIQAQTTSLLEIYGETGTGWVGAANVGMLHITTKVAGATTTAPAVYIGTSAAINDSRGHALRIIDSSSVAGTMGYPVVITSADAQMGGIIITTDAAGAALTVAAGTASFAGVVTFTAGVKMMVAVTDTANPPTNANCITAFGAAATAGAGFFGIIDDGGGHANEYLIWSDGTKYWQVTGTAGG